MSAISFSFRPDAIPAYAQAEFLTRFCQLVLDYQTLTEPQQEAPPAESLPTPDFAPVEGDESVPVAPKKERKNPWAGLTEEQKAERLAAMKRGREMKKQEKRRLSEDSLAVAEPVTHTETITDKYSGMTGQQLRDELADREGIAPTPEGTNPKGLRANTPKFPHAEDIRNELRRRDAAPAAEAAADSDAVSETSSKTRKNPWADLTPEQKAERLAKMKAAREAKKEAKLAAQGSA
jgi:hypothetical protein